MLPSMISPRGLSILQRSLFFLLIFVLCLQVVRADDEDDADSSFTDPSIFRKVVLDVHNSVRESHNASALSWNSMLADFAKGHSGTCVFEHSTNSPYGENLAAGYANASASVQAWADEEKNYSYSSPGFSEDTGHFTQMVWKASKQIGCAAVACDGMLMAGITSWYVTCEYEPAGNVVGWFEENVQKGSAESSAARAWGRGGCGMRGMAKVLAVAAGVVVAVVEGVL